jgi:hypothetical protein
LPQSDTKLPAVLSNVSIRRPPAPTPVYRSLFHAKLDGMPIASLVTKRLDPSEFVRSHRCHKSRKDYSVAIVSSLEILNCIVKYKIKMEYISKLINSIPECDPIINSVQRLDMRKIYIKMDHLPDLLNSVPTYVTDERNLPVTLGVATAAGTYW